MSSTLTFFAGGSGVETTITGGGGPPESAGFSTAGGRGSGGLPFSFFSAPCPATEDGAGTGASLGLSARNQARNRAAWTPTNPRMRMRVRRLPQPPVPPSTRRPHWVQKVAPSSFQLLHAWHCNMTWRAPPETREYLYKPDRTDTTDGPCVQYKDCVQRLKKAGRLISKAAPRRLKNPRLAAIFSRQC